jgi:ribonuclease HI
MAGGISIVYFLAYMRWPFSRPLSPARDLKNMLKQLFPNKKIIVYTDGGARGNPGPAAIGVVINGPIKSPAGDHGVNKEYGEYVGEITNNQAEYKALVFALKKIKQLIGKAKAKEAEVEVRIDSELVVRQLNGRYKILDESLQSLFFEIWNLKFDFKRVEFTHVPREENKKADALVNKALDSLL